MGEGLLVYHAAMMKRAGTDIESLYKWLGENTLKLCHWFTVGDLNHLKRGGRVSTTAALVGTMLGIKPVLHVDDEGHLIPVSKVRGRRQSLDALVQKMAETAIQPQEQTVFISHGDCLEDAQYVAEQVRQKFGVQDIRIITSAPSSVPTPARARWRCSSSAHSAERFGEESMENLLMARKSSSACAITPSTGTRASGAATCAACRKTASASFAWPSSRGISLSRRRAASTTPSGTAFRPRRRMRHAGYFSVRRRRRRPRG